MGSIILSIVVSTFLINPTYQSNTKLIVYNKQKSDQGITTSDIEVNTKLAHTYGEIIKSKNVLDSLIKKMNLNVSYENLYNNIKIDNIDDTGIINIIITSNDPKIAYRIANEIPNILLNMIISIILGIFIGFIIIFLDEYLDKRIKYKKNIKNISKIDILGIVPYMKVRKNIFNEIDYMKLDDGINIEIYKNIIKNIEFSDFSKEMRSIMFVSCNEKEGTSTIISDIAIYLANIGKKVLIIDLNLINPSISKMLNVDSSILKSIFEDINFEEYITETDIKNLDVFSIKEMPSKTSDILKSDEIKSFIQNIKNECIYDYIFIDTPSISVSHDIEIISSYADEVIIIVENKKLKESQLLDLKDNLYKANLKILGVILNKLNYKKTIKELG